MENLVRIGAAATALGVSADTLRRWEKDGRIEFVRRSGQRWMKTADLALLARERHAIRSSSARNRLEGVVVEVKRDGVTAQVELACGPHRVVSLMSREAADELGLEPGRPAAAIIKATSVIVEADKQ